MSSNKTDNGIGFVGVLQIVFLTLKLCGQINWSWWWVLSPFWIAFVLAVIVEVLKHYEEDKRQR